MKMRNGKQISKPGILMSYPKIHLKEQKKKKICRSLREDREWKNNKYLREVQKCRTGWWTLSLSYESHLKGKADISEPQQASIIPKEASARIL